MGSTIHMKNIVFIPNIDLGNGRNKPYEYSIKSWKHFCDKYDCELLVLEDLLVPVESMKVTWQRFYLFDILEQNEIPQQIDEIPILSIAASFASMPKSLNL